MFIFFPFLGITQTIFIQGVVFEDRNGNGQQDPGEPGIKHIPVSNGSAIVSTDRKGFFELTANAGEVIFPILPDGYTWAVVTKQAGNPCFPVNNASDDKNEKVKFGLQKQKKITDFQLAAIGDIQVGNNEEVNYAAQSILSELSTRKDIDLNIFLGDIVNNTPELMPVMSGLIQQLPAPSRFIAGNHDRDNLTDPEKKWDSFRQYFGSDVYAFNYGSVHFILLNNIYSKGKFGYEGRLSENQLQFIKNDLQFVPNDHLIVICQHIPLKHMIDKDLVIGILENRENVLILSGHTHQVGRVFYPGKNRKKPIHEIITGASCGNFWLGEKDWQGVPLGIMQCGSPRNYFTLHFKENNYTFQFKGVAIDGKHQMDIWTNGIDTLDRKVPELSNLEKDQIIASIYGASDSTHVFISIDNGPWLPMEKKNVVAPYILRLITWNKSDIYPTAISRRSALRTQPSPHTWMFLPPKGLTEGIHSLQIKALDNWGFNVQSSRLIYKR